MVRINKRKIIARLKGVDRFNVGCGPDFIKGWLNIGLFSKIPYGSLRKRKKALVFHFDMTEELPFQKESVKYVYASHFIEHLNFRQGTKVLKGLFEIMKKGGIIRLTFPDLELWAKKYVKDDMSFFRKYHNNTKKYNFLNLKTKGEIFMSQVHGWDHKWCYDFESIKDILERAGFSDIKKKKAFDSMIPGIKKLEPSGQDRLLETTYVEAKKA